LRDVWSAAAASVIGIQSNAASAGARMMGAGRCKRAALVRARRGPPAAAQGPCMGTEDRKTTLFDREPALARSYEQGPRWFIPAYEPATRWPTSSSRGDLSAAARTRAGRRSGP
jgi:hypothetical protein